MKKESFIVLVFVIICMVAFFFSLRKSITNANNDKDVEYQMDDIEYFVKGVLADKDEYGTPVRERLIPIISEAYEKVIGRMWFYWLIHSLTVERYMMIPF